MAEQDFSAQAGNIEEFVISANTSDRAVDMSNGVVDFKYYESVLSNGITATATIVETGYTDEGADVKGGILDGLPIRGGERTDIRVMDAQPVHNELNFTDEGLYINRVRGADPGTQKDLYFIDFVSKDFLSNDKTRVVSRYDGKISANVGSILKNVLKTSKEVEADETAFEYNFIGNDRKPFYVCTWLASKSAPDKAVGATAGYFFYQTYDGFKFKSIDKLLGQNPVKKYIYNNTGQTPPGYDGNIDTYSIERDIDLHQNLTLGSYNNRSFFFDLLVHQYIGRSFSIAQQQGKVENAGNPNDFIVVADQFIDSPSRVMSHIMDYGTLPTGKNADQQLKQWRERKTESNYNAPEVMVQSIMRYNQLFTIQVNITIPGDFSIRAGDMIECDFKYLEEGEPDATNSQSGGLYMVAHVCHNLTPKKTFTSLTLVRDSFGKKGGFDNSPTATAAQSVTPGGPLVPDVDGQNRNPSASILRLRGV